MAKKLSAMGEAVKAAQEQGKTTTAVVDTPLGNDAVAAVHAQEPATAKAEAPAIPVAYTVHLKCLTPLANNPARIAAVSEDEAWAKFCELNGISGSDHPREITRA